MSRKPPRKHGTVSVDLRLEGHASSASVVVGMEGVTTSTEDNVLVLQITAPTLREAQRSSTPPLRPSRGPNPRLSPEAGLMRAGPDRRAMDGEEKRRPRPRGHRPSNDQRHQRRGRHAEARPAAVAFGDLIRGTYGPNGLDKMLYKSNGETAVTNDGARIVADLLVKHPAAKTFVSMAETQENAMRRWRHGCLIFAAELMREGGRLLERSLHPLTLVEGYREAAGITLATAEARSVDATQADEARWSDVALTAMTGTSAEAGGGELASLVVEAALLVQRTAEGDPLSYERIRMAKRGAGNLGDSRLIQGIILDRRVALDRQARLWSRSRSRS